MPALMRSLVRRPAFASGMLLTLTLVIGLSTAIFSTVYGLILRPLPYRDPGQLVTIRESNRAIGADNLPVTEGAFPIIARDSRSFESVAAYGAARDAITRNPIFAWRVWGTEETLHERACTSQLFPTLGVLPLLGRTFSADEDVRKEGRTQMVHRLRRRPRGRHRGQSLAAQRRLARVRTSVASPGGPTVRSRGTGSSDS